MPIVTTDGMIRTKKISVEMLHEAFNQCKSPMFAFKTKEDAEILAMASLEKHSTSPDKVRGKINFFAVPVIYCVEGAVELDDKPKKIFNAEAVYQYMDKSTIPLNHKRHIPDFYELNAITRLNQIIQELLKDYSTNTAPYFYLVNPNELRLIEAQFILCDPIRRVAVSFETIEESLESINGTIESEEHNCFSSCSIC